MLTTEAPENPYSALKFDCSTRNSSTASGDGYRSLGDAAVGLIVGDRCAIHQMSAVALRLPLDTKFVPVHSWALVAHCR